MVNTGETITLVCVASGGDPAPSLEWVRPGGEELPKRSVVNGGTLTIPAISLEDGGAYTCLGSNDVGNPAKKTTIILVRGTISHSSLLFIILSRMEVVITFRIPYISKL